jgi:hypothetical protein
MSGNAPETTPQNKAQRGRKPAKVRGKKNKTVKAATQPSRCRTPLHKGVYINPPRIKHCLDADGINRAIEDAINELRDAEPHEVDIVDPKTGKKTGKTQTTQLVAFDKISETTRALVKRAKLQNEEREKENIKREKARAEKLAEDIRAGRVDAKKLEEEHAATVEAEAKLQEERAAKDAARKAMGHPVRGPKKVTKYSNEIELISKMRIRFAKEGATQVAASICAALHELLEFGMENALKQNRKILKRKHVLQPGFEQLPLACLYRNLDVFKNAQIEEAKRQEAENKKHEIRLKKKEDADQKEDPKTEEEDEDDLTEDDDDEERNFSHYVKQVCHNIMNQKIEKDKKEKHPYEDIRISLEIREFGSQLITDFVKRLCPLLKGQINTMGVKTISQSVIRQTIQFQLEYSGVDPTPVNARIDAKVEEYRAWMKRKKEEKIKAALEKEAEKDAKKNTEEKTDDEDDTVETKA